MVEVTLTQTQIELGLAWGKVLRLEALSAGAADRHGAAGRVGTRSEDAFTQDQAFGVWCELAAATVLGLPRNPTVNTWKGGPADIGKATEVRGHRARLLPDGSHGAARSGQPIDMIVRDEDADDRYFVHVSGVHPTYRVYGYILGRLAKRAEWLKDRGGYGKPCYWVPIAALTPVASISKAARYPG